MQRITPYLLYEDVASALVWLARAFGFREYGTKTLGADGKVNQAAMILEDFIIILRYPGPDDQAPKEYGYVTQNLYVSVKDLDKHFEQARDAGATILQEPGDMSYGERRYIAADPGGHHWYFTKRVPAESSAPSRYDKAALTSPRANLFLNFGQSIYQLALMADPLKVQELLSSKYGIHLSVEEIRTIQGSVPKKFNFGLIELWAAKQPQEALAWAASISWLVFNNSGVDILQLFLNAARKSLPNLNREMLDRLMPDGPGKAYALDITEAATDPYSLANRILDLTNPAERSSQLKALAKGWPDPEISAEWARQNLSGAEKSKFYSHIGYDLAHKNPQAALQVLSELKLESIAMKSYCIDPQSASYILAELNSPGTYAFTLGAMMRGLVQIGGHGKMVAELIASYDLKPKERARLISELVNHWVRHDADATIEWVKTLTEPDDVRAAIPHLVSQLDSDRVSLTMEAYLNNPDPVMELALVKAAAPPGLYFDPQKSRLILDPLISRDAGLKLRSSKGRGVNKEEMLWRSVNLTAKRLAEVGPPADAIGWLGTLTFASQRDYAKAVGTVLTVGKLKSPTEAAEWVEKSTLDAILKSVLQKIVKQ
jgi:PhnB protein